MNIRDKVLLVEDERTIRSFMQAILTANGYDVLMAGTGAMADTMIASHCPDIIILDLGLPDMDGMTILRNVRKWSKVPILVVSARSHERDKVEALDAGADDYLTKPFDIRELLACINALLRRQVPQVDQLMLGNTVLDLGACTLSCGIKYVRLSAKEFDVMRFLLQAQSSIISKEVILAWVWGYDSEAVENHVEVYVGFLRKKLRSIGSNIRIEAVRRLGYRLEVDETC